MVNREGEQEWYIKSKAREKEERVGREEEIERENERKVRERISWKRIKTLDSEKGEGKRWKRRNTRKRKRRVSERKRWKRNKKQIVTKERDGDEKEREIEEE